MTAETQDLIPFTDEIDGPAEPITEERAYTYVHRDQGGACPSCGSSDIYADDSPQIDEGRALQDVSCLACGAEWRDVYVLSYIYVDANRMGEKKQEESDADQA